MHKKQKQNRGLFTFGIAIGLFKVFGGHASRDGGFDKLLLQSSLLLVSSTEIGGRVRSGGRPGTGISGSVGKTGNLFGVFRRTLGSATSTAAVVQHVKSIDVNVDPGPNGPFVNRFVTISGLS